METLLLEIIVHHKTQRRSYVISQKNSSVISQYQFKSPYLNFFIPICMICCQKFNFSTVSLQKVLTNERIWMLYFHSKNSIPWKGVGVLKNKLLVIWFEVTTRESLSHYTMWAIWVFYTHMVLFEWITLHLLNMEIVNKTLM